VHVEQLGPHGGRGLLPAGIGAVLGDRRCAGSQQRPQRVGRPLGDRSARDVAVGLRYETGPATSSDTITFRRISLSDLR
jgi:hypothetical protein